MAQASIHSFGNVEAPYVGTRIIISESPSSG